MASLYCIYWSSSNNNGQFLVCKVSQNFGPKHRGSQVKSSKYMKSDNEYEKKKKVKQACSKKYCSLNSTKTQGLCGTLDLRLTIFFKSENTVYDT